MPASSSSRSARMALALALLAAPTCAVSGPWHDDGPVAIRLVSPWLVAPRGAELALGLEVALDPGWHIYWLNSGDAGYPPRLDFGGTPGLVTAELRFPVPHRYDLPGKLVAFGYGERVVYPVTLRGTFGDTPTLDVTGTVDYVVCAGECIPFTTHLELVQPFGEAARPDAESRALLAAWSSRVPTPAPEGTATGRLLERSDAGGTLEIAFAGLPEEPTDLFFAPHELVELGRPVALAVRGDDRGDRRHRFAVPFAWKVRPSGAPPELGLEWTLAFGESGWTGRTGVPLGAASAPATQPSGPITPTDPAPLTWPWRVVVAATALGLVWALWPRAKGGPRP